MSSEWKKELENTFFKTSIDGSDVENAINIKFNHIPNSLYKYREVNEFSLKNLKEDTVWCSNASDFNDPYDSSICFYTNNLFESSVRSLPLSNNDLEIDPNILLGLEKSDDPLRKLLQNISKSTNELITSDQENEYIRIIKEIMVKQSAQMNREFNKGLQNGYKICSFSERIDSMLMWSHYADYHKGFAVEYNFNNLPIGDIRSRCLWPVFYEEKLFDATPYFEEQKNNGNFNNLFGIIASIHKAKDWSYENEWRMIIPFSPKDPPTAYNVPVPLAIYLGSKMSGKNKDEIIEIAEKKKLEIFEMETAHDKFEMIKKVYLRS